MIIQKHGGIKLLVKQYDKHFINKININSSYQFEFQNFSCAYIIKQ